MQVLKLANNALNITLATNNNHQKMHLSTSYPEKKYFNDSCIELLSFFVFLPLLMRTGLLI